MSLTSTKTSVLMCKSKVWKHLPGCIRPFTSQLTTANYPICARCISTILLKRNTPPCKCGLPSHQAAVRLHHIGQSRCKNEMANSIADVRGGPPWRLVFFGTDQFSIASLKALHKCRTEGNLIDTLHVVCPDTKYIKRRGRTRLIAPVLKYCHDNDLPILPWPITEKVRGYDLGVLSSFGHLVPEHVIESFPYGIANIHPSVLPRWRGASPITHAILEGDKTTGVSIMRIMAKRFDVGPILLQEKLDIPERSTAESLQDILADQGADMIIRVLSALPTFIENEKMQTDDGVTLCGKIVSSMSVIDWSRTCTDIDRLYRAIGKKFPLKTRWHGNWITLNQMADPKQTAAMDIKISDAAAGEVCYNKEEKQVCIKCKDGWVSFGEVTFRKKMSAKDFYNGYLSGKDTNRQYFT